MKASGAAVRLGRRFAGRVSGLRGLEAELDRLERVRLAVAGIEARPGELEQAGGVVAALLLGWPVTAARGWAGVVTANLDVAEKVKGVTEGAAALERRLVPTDRSL
jgi:hypothetical protein